MLAISLFFAVGTCVGQEVPLEVLSDCNIEASNAYSDEVNEETQRHAAALADISMAYNTAVAACGTDNDCLIDAQAEKSTSTTLESAQHENNLNGISYSVNQAAETCINQWLTTQIHRELAEMCAANPNDLVCLYWSDPIVIDINGDGFEFTNIEDEFVYFDLNTDGFAEKTAWTTVDTDDAFLILDRNDNNNVDDGTEVFGNGTKLLSGEFAVFGFHALIELDSMAWGGNEDGVISKDDRQFKKLGLWTDRNQNGVSERSEVEKLTNSNIVAIDLNYYVELDPDLFGNFIALKSQVLKREKGKMTIIEAADVYFRVE